MSDDGSTNRRQFLAALGASGATGGLAGCSGFLDDLSGNGSGGTNAPGTDGGESGTDGGESGTGTNGSPGTDSGGSSGPAVGPEDWPMRNFDAAQTSRRTGLNGPGSSLTEQWSVTHDLENSPGARYLPLVAGDGYLVTVTTEGTVYAYDAASGTEEWTYDVKARDGYLRETRGGIALYDGTVYVARGSMSDFPKYAIDVETGTVQWTATSGSTFDPVFADGHLYGLAHEGLVAYDVADGTKQWTVDVNGGNTIAVANGTVYTRAGTGDGWELLAVEAASGSEQWRSDVITASDVPRASHVSVGDGTVYTASEDGTVIAFDAASGSTSWESNPYTETETNTTDTYPREPPVVGQDHVFLGGFSVHALSKSDGAEQWSAGQMNANRYFSALIDGELITLADPGIIAFDPSNGEELWTYQSDRRWECFSDLAVTSERVFVAKDECGGQSAEIIALGSAE